MSTKSRHVVWGSKIMGAEMRAETARKAAKEAVRKADRAEAEAWSIRMQGYGGPARPPAEAERRYWCRCCGSETAVVSCSR